MPEVTTLERINGDVQSRITTLLNNPTLPGKREVQTTIVAGIEVIDKRRSDNDLDTFIKMMKQYQADAAALEAKLSNAGVKFLAIIPTTMWNSICDDAGLYRFSPDTDGRVSANNSTIQTLESSALQKLGMRPLGALALGGLTSGVGGFILTNGATLAWHLAATAAVAMVGAYVCGALAERYNFDKGKPRPNKLANVEAQLLADRLASHEAVLDTFWPDRTEGNSSFKVKISVPPAPGDVQENLSRAAAAKLHLSLAVVGEAISFDESPTGLLLGLRGDRYKEIANEIQSIKDKEAIERQRRLEALQNDPIVTTSLGLATAAIVQYGDFPIEQAVVERALDECKI
jgi:hypothetical protein